MSPELDRLCSMVFAYLAFQVVGFCWAFLVNASFAVACQLPTRLLPTDMFTTIQLMSALYISYASIRVVIAFAQAVFHLALESLVDFPQASQKLSKGGKNTLFLAPVAFIPALLLECSLVVADTLCGSENMMTSTDSTLFSSTSSHSLFSNAFEFPFSTSSSSMPLSSSMLISNVSSKICRHTGIFFLTSSYPEVRRLIFYSLFVMVIQVFQVFLHQFPRWDSVFKQLKKSKRVGFQLSIVMLGLATIFYMVVQSTSSSSSSSTANESNNVDNYLCVLLFAWTLWLCLFVPSLISLHGDTWTSTVTPASLQALAAYLRLSQICIVATIFLGVVCFRGFLQAQLDVTNDFDKELVYLFDVFVGWCMFASKTMVVFAGNTSLSGVFYLNLSWRKYAYSWCYWCYWWWRWRRWR